MRPALHAATLAYWTGLPAIWCFASLYRAAMLVDPSAGLQVTGMLGLEKGSGSARLYGWLYTGALVATALCAAAFWRFPFCRHPMMVLAGAALGLTVLPVAHSLLYDFRPGFYEYYVGEGLTILTLILLSVAGALCKSPNRSEL